MSERKPAESGPQPPLRGSMGAHEAAAMNLSFWGASLAGHRQRDWQPMRAQTALCGVIPSEGSAELLSGEDASGSWQRLMLPGEIVKQICPPQ